MKHFILALLALALTSVHSYALTGTVTHLQKGELTLKSKSGDKNLKLNDSIPSGSTISFKGGDSAIVKLKDSSLIKLKDNSEITLSNDPTPTIELEKGAVFTQVTPSDKKQSSPKPRFMLRARGVVMGVRGTEFFTALGPKDNVWMCVGKGVVEAGKKDDATKVAVKEGEGILVEKNKKIEPPKAYEWTKKLNWNMSPADGETKDLSTLEAEYSNLLRQTYD